MCNRALPVGQLRRITHARQRVTGSVCGLNSMDKHSPPWGRVRPFPAVTRMRRIPLRATGGGAACSVASPGRGLLGVGVVERESGAGLGVWLLDERRPPSLNSGGVGVRWRGAGRDGCYCTAAARSFKQPQVSSNGTTCASACKHTVVGQISHARWSDNDSMIRQGTGGEYCERVVRCVSMVCVSR